MPRVACLVVCLVGSLVSPHAAFAQQPAQVSDSPSPLSMLEKVRIDRGGGIHLSSHFAVVFGGIKQGSGPAAGPAVSWEPASGEFIQLKAGYSWNRFQLLQARFDSRPFFGKRSTFSTRLRWQDAPHLSLYRSGPDSPNRRVEFGERKTEGSGALNTVIGSTTLAVGSGLERYSSDSGWIDPGEDEVLGEVPVTPGLGTRPWFVHSFVSASIDTRLSRDFSRTGRLLEVGVHDYRDEQNGSQSFGELELSAAQLLPTGRQGESHAEFRGALGLFAHAWLTHTSDGRSVPFFLMPTLGGGTYLRAYSGYRYRDRNALLVGAEYRWAVHEMVDVAALYEAGTVSPTIGGFSLGTVAQSVGGGLRVHSKTSGLLHMDLARGRDGFKFSIGMTVGS
jgi:hypothetical protein